MLTLKEGCGTSAVEGTPLISSPGTSLQPSPTGKNRNGGKQKYHPVTTDCQRISFYSLRHMPPCMYQPLKDTLLKLHEALPSPLHPPLCQQTNLCHILNQSQNVTRLSSTGPQMMMMMDMKMMMMMVMMTRTRSKFVPLELCHRYVIASFQP